MPFDNSANRNGFIAQVQSIEGPQRSARGWKELTPQRVSPASTRRRHVLAIISILLLLLLVFAVLRLSMVASGTNDLLQLRIGDQQAALLDLRQSLPISPYLLGTNVFPKEGSLSRDSVYPTGFMPYTPKMVSDLRNSGVKLLRYPGGDWGEEHTLSYDQLNDFSNMLIATHSEGILSAHLSSIVDTNGTAPDTNLTDRAHLAGRWVDYMNNHKSDIRAPGKGHEKDAFHPVKFWTVGNEPDRPDPLTHRSYTVAEYVDAFVAFSEAMHKNEPTIKVFGPELSQFYGVGAGPRDAEGALWMEKFLEGVGQIEQTRHEILLDGVSFHRYQFHSPDQAPEPALLMSSTDEWNYLLPSLRQLIKHDFGRDVPIAITEINTNPSPDLSPTPGQAMLWWADTLGTLMNQEVEFVAFFSTAGVDNPYPLFTRDGLHETPMERVMELFGHLQHHLVPLAIQRDPISVYATQDDTHKTVSLLFVNKSVIPQLAQISPVTSFASISPWPTLDISLAGDSITVVTMHRSGSDTATAYSYIAPAHDDPTVAPIRYTVCGNKTDVLASDIPC
jgi:hypothetical protein